MQPPPPTLPFWPQRSATGPEGEPLLLLLLLQVAAAAASGCSGSSP